MCESSVFSAFTAHTAVLFQGSCVTPKRNEGHVLTVSPSPDPLPISGRACSGPFVQMESYPTRPFLSRYFTASNFIHIIVSVRFRFIRGSVVRGSVPVVSRGMGHSVCRPVRLSVPVASRGPANFNRLRVRIRSESLTHIVKLDFSKLRSPVCGFSWSLIHSHPATFVARRALRLYLEMSSFLLPSQRTILPDLDFLADKFSVSVLPRRSPAPSGGRGF